MSITIDIIKVQGEWVRCFLTAPFKCVSTNCLEPTFNKHWINIGREIIWKDENSILYLLYYMDDTKTIAIPIYRVLLYPVTVLTFMYLHKMYMLR